MNTIIEVKNLSKTYKITHDKQLAYGSFRDDLIKFIKNPIKKKEKTELFWALKNVSFDVKKGEAIGIIGANGAGKSTLLKVLSRITPPTHGKVTLKGRVASLLEVGTGFHPELTGRENIFLSGAILGMSNREIVKNFNEIVSFAEIEKFLDTPVKHYSSGMYVRLAFAVAAYLEPEILLVDEILAVGDVRFQKKSLGKMKSLGKSGRTILFVSHNLAAIRSFCTRAILLEHGNVVANGSVEGVIKHYMQNVQKNVFEKKWDNIQLAPRNRSCALTNVAVLNSKDKIPQQLTTDDAFTVRITYKILHDNAFAGFAIYFYDSENRCIFLTLSNHEKNWYAKPMSEGVYVSTCHIPKSFFNAGEVSMRITLFEANFSDSFISQDILHFEIMDGIQVRKDYYGEYDGVVRPLFPWSTKKLYHGK